MPAHIKSALTNNQISLSIKIVNYYLELGRAYIYLNIRLEAHKRTIIHHFIGE
jgi:thiamine phosphate synthase YjbQ (UPF0047 family)